MPGIVGFAGKSAEVRLQMFLSDMAQTLKEEDWYQVELYQRGGAGLGRISLGLANPEPQPIFNESETLCLVMEGEVYDYQDWKAKLLARGHRFAVDNDAEFVLHLYEELGDEFASTLNGAFVVAIWDQQARKLLLANDRLGLHPLYYAHHNERFSFASGVRALLVDSALPRSVDEVAIAQFLTFDHPLGDRTLLKEVRLMPPASLLTFSEGRLKILPYWTMKYPEVSESRDEQSYGEELIFHLRRAVARRVRGELGFGLLLSGGLDSRMLLALMAEHLSGPTLHTFTFGVPRCDDARFAREAAAKVGARHHFYVLRPEYLLEKAEKAVRLTDGLENCIHAHSLATLTEESAYAKVFFKGFFGDALMGFWVTRELLARYDEAALPQLLSQYYCLAFSQSQQKCLFTESFRQRIDGAVVDPCKTVLLEAGSKIAADQRNYFDLKERQRRMTLNGVELVRSQVVVRTPYCDNDLVDFMLTVPAGLRLERYLIKRVLVASYPELAKIPTTEANLPLTTCRRDLLIRIERQVRWRLRAAGLNWIAVSQGRSYVDYDAAMRTTLRRWVEDTLLDGRTLERGYFNPDYIRELLAEHMAGADHASKLGALLSLELWHRQFLD